MKTWLDFMPPYWQEFLTGSRGRTLPEPVSFPDSARSRHGLFLGGTGVGKSRLFEALVVLDAARRVTGKSTRGVAVIDVHGDIYQNLRARLSLMALDFPQLESLVYLIDPTVKAWSVRYNPLEPRPGETPELRADMLASVVTTVYHDDPTIVTRMRWLLWHAFLTLILAKLPLTFFLRLLRDENFRKELIPSLNHLELTAYWFLEFPKSQREAMAWAESSLDRMGRFVTNPFIKPILEGNSTIDFREFMDKGAVVLINAPKGKIGEDASYLLCAFILAEFQQAALSRVDVPDHERTPFTLLADEFANYTTDSVRQILAESRKVGLELLLAGQELGQLRDERLRSAVLNSVGNIFCFRLGYQDAEVLVKNVFTPDLEQAKPPPGFKADYSWRPLNEIWELEIRKLTELPDRTLWWKRKGVPGSHQVRALSVADIEQLPRFDELPEALREQEAKAERLAGIQRMPEIRIERPESEHRQGGDNGKGGIIYLPPPSDNGDEPVFRLD